MTLGEAIRKARESRGFTRRDIEEKTGVTINTILGWENGTHQPRAMPFIMVADALNISLEELAGRQELNPPDEKNIFETDIDRIGRAMRKARKKRGLTQKECAKLMGVQIDAISKWENDRQSPTLATLIAASDALGVTLDELTGRKKKPKEPTAAEEALAEIKDARKKLTAQQYKTLKGQVMAGDTDAALKGLEKLMGKINKKI